jgi:hypothetical protein
MGVEQGEGGYCHVACAGLFSIEILRLASS